MAAVYRSAKMALCHIYIPSEVSFQCMAALGEAGLVEIIDFFPDLSPSKRKYTAEIQNCDNLELTVRSLIKTIAKEKIKMAHARRNILTPDPNELFSIKSKGDSDSNLYELKDLVEDIKEVNEHVNELEADLQHLYEIKDVLNLYSVVFRQNGRNSREPRLHQTNLGFDKHEFLCGAIAKSKLNALSLALWRFARGNVVLYDSAHISKKQYQPELEDSCTFIVIYEGDLMGDKIVKLCEGFKANVFKVPEEDSERAQMLQQVTEDIDAIKIVLNQTIRKNHQLLKTAANNARNWLIQILKVKSTYVCLNLCNVYSPEQLCIVKCWIPVKDVSTVENILQDVAEGYETEIKPKVKVITYPRNAPTYFPLNKFTRAFQNLIDAYGIATYREINPMPFTIITFPFLFAVMFGDTGHGIIMTFFAVLMVGFEKKLEKADISNEMWTMIFAGRYIILLMGLFAIYAGIIYNDIVSVSPNVFGSSWRINYKVRQVKTHKSLQLNPETDFSGSPYPYGIDPIWAVALNQIDFLNNFKMKTSIVLGVLQMYFGIFLNFFNHLYFRNYLGIFFEFIPQLIFFTNLFVYLVFLIIYKWIKYGVNKGFQNSPYCAPSILMTFINMVLFKSANPRPGCSAEMYPHQKIIEKCLLISAFFTIPIMLLGRPLMNLFFRGKKIKEKKQVQKASILVGGDRSEITTGHTDEEEEEGDIGEVFIHEAIHTIEFVLGSVSYTASYLRLWALSLAHSQLAEVLWTMVLVMGLNVGQEYSPKKEVWVKHISTYISFIFWAILTVAILVIMEGLSAFLHALRLHWMEFQSKFYAGRGYSFCPFSFKHIRPEVDIQIKTAILLVQK